MMYIFLAGLIVQQFEMNHLYLHAKKLNNKTNKTISKVHACTFKTISTKKAKIF